MEQFGSLREGVTVNIQRSDGKYFSRLIYNLYFSLNIIGICQDVCIKPLLLNCILLRIASQLNGVSAMKQKEKKSN